MYMIYKTNVALFIKRKNPTYVLLKLWESLGKCLIGLKYYYHFQQMTQFNSRFKGEKNLNLTISPPAISLNLRQKPLFSEIISFAFYSENKWKCIRIKLQCRGNSETLNQSQWWWHDSLQWCRIPHTLPIIVITFKCPFSYGYASH